MPFAHSKPSVDHDIAAIAAQCVKCGLCLPHCPSYFVTRNEADSPRGRLALMAMIATHQLPQGEQPSLDRCLACGRCERICPANVPFIDALVATRKRFSPIREHWSGRLARWAAQHRHLRRPLPAIAIKIRRWLPSALRRRLDLDGLAATSSPALPTPEPNPDEGLQILVLAGCMATGMEGGASMAIRHIAQRLALPLHVDRAHCCGALNEHLGHPAAVSAEEAPRAASVVAINSGCLSQWRRTFGTRDVIGIATWLEDLCSVHAKRLISRSRRIALHLPCTQQAQPEEAAAMRRLVARLPGAALVELPAQPGCCGAAGTYFMNQPEIAQALADSVSTHIRSTQADIVLSANGACRAQLAQALFDAGSDIRVMHPAELVLDHLDDPSR